MAIWPQFGSEASPMTPIDIRGVLTLGHEASTMTLIHRWLLLLRHIFGLVTVVCLGLALIWYFHQRIGSSEMVAKPDQIGSEIKVSAAILLGRRKEYLQRWLLACNNMHCCCSVGSPVANVDIFALFSQGTIDLPFQWVLISDCGIDVRSFCCRATAAL